MMLDNDDIDQQYKLQILSHKRPTRKQVIADMLKSRAYNRSYRGKIEHVSIDCVDLNLSYDQDFDLSIDYKTSINCLRGWQQIMMVMWVKGMSVKELAVYFNTSEYLIGKEIKESLNKIRNKLGVRKNIR
jgi:hypothetical protein